MEKVNYQTVAQNEELNAYSLGCGAIARTDFL